MNSIGVVIVTWNSGAAIDRAIASCAGLSVTVVDNASTDDTVERVRRHQDVYLIANSENRGFAAAANQGIARTPDDFVLLLNPDAELLDSVDALAEACANPDVAIAAGRLVDANGVTQKGFTVRRFPTALTLAFETLGFNRVFPRNRVNRRYRCLDLDLDSEADVEQPAGAFILFRRDVWRDLGGFDESFSPVWFEDVDFAKRALKRGRIRYLPSVSARHKGGASIACLDWSSREAHWYVSLLRYASKHFTPWRFRGLCGAVVLGSAVRSIVGIFERRTLKAIAVYARVASLSMRCLVLGRVPVATPVAVAQQGSRVRTMTGSTK